VRARPLPPANNLGVWAPTCWTCPLIGRAGSFPHVRSYTRGVPAQVLNPARAHGRGAPSRLRLGVMVALGASALLLAIAIAVGFAYAGSPARLPNGVLIAGVHVGGLTPAQAQALLEQRAEALGATPVSFTAGTERWDVTPAQLGVKVDWAAAVVAAAQQGDGFGPVRGFRRLQTRFFGAAVAPPTRVYDAALTYTVDRIATEVAERPREASIELQGLKPRIVPSRTGRSLNRASAEAVIVRSLASFSRAPVGLPVRVEPPQVTADELQPVLARVEVALSAPVRLAHGETRWRLPRWRIAELLSLPKNGQRELGLAGPGADGYFERLGEIVSRPPKDASFAADGDGNVRVVGGTAGVELDRERTAAALLTAATSTEGRLANVAVRRAQPALTTERAQSLGITRVLATYTTAYAGTADRIHNLQLGVRFLDGALVAPGATFSFNERVGERTEARGFRAAPVIINGEYEDGIGGGVSQVATTVFNAAWEAGLRITTRAAHALYISRYPLGRDATVNFPDLDLKFVNDTGGWIVVRAFAHGDGISVGLWGTATGRRVESEPGELRETGPAPVRTVLDPELPKGERVVVEEGQPARAVSVKRTVYDRDGNVLHSETWHTAYRGEYELVRVGTKEPPPPKPKDEPNERPAPGATTPATTTPAAPAPAPPPPTSP
jgi:vancomycin resistance protein YoaR